jgi:regulator of extracellular matrix RemA (YlzA/DUF370 family)
MLRTTTFPIGLTSFPWTLSGIFKPLLEVVSIGGEMDQTLLNIGFGSSVVADRVVAIVSPNSAPMKRLKDEAKEEKRLVDATHGRRTRSIIVMDSNHIVLSAIQAETVSQRYATLKELT